MYLVILVAIRPVRSPLTGHRGQLHIAFLGFDNTPTPCIQFVFALDNLNACCTMDLHACTAVRL